MQYGVKRAGWWRRVPAAACAAVVLGAAPPRPAAESGTVVVLIGAARDSMSAVFLRNNEHWNELGDLNTIEKMLAVRPTQREFLGCLQGRATADTVYVTGWQPARGMKQLQMAVAGNCDSVPALVGTWHTHPYRADQNNRPLKERRLSAQDLETFRQSRFPLVLVMWDADSLDAAVRRRDGGVTHPAQVLTPVESATRRGEGGNGGVGARRGDDD